MKKILVRAIDPHKVPLFSERELIMGRYVGRLPDGTIIKEGVSVDYNTDTIRAINRGELEELKGSE